MKNETFMTGLSHILSDLFHKMNAKGRMEQAALRTIWNRAVGERIAEKAQPESLRNNVLYVAVDNSVWMQELHFLKDAIRDKINSELQSMQLTDIRFTLGRISRPARSAQGPSPPLHNDELHRIEHEAACIKDPDVRQAFKAVMAASLKNKKGR